MDNKPADNKSSSLTRTHGITIAAFIGFVLGSVLFFGLRKGGESHFREISYAPKEIVLHLLDTADLGKAQYFTTLATKPAVVAATTQPAAKTTGKAIAKKTSAPAAPAPLAKLSIKDTLMPEILKQRYLVAYGTDSLSKNALQIDKTELSMKMLDEPGNPVKWNYYLKKGSADPMYQMYIQKEIPLAIIPASSNTAFFMKYPGFGLWTFLILVQFSLFTAFLAIIYQSLIMTNRALKDIGKARPGDSEDTGFFTGNYWGARFWRNFCLSFLVVLVFFLVIYNCFTDNQIVQGYFFYNNLDWVFGPLFALGYTMVVFCFTGYLLISGFSLRFKRTVKEEGDDTAMKLENQLTLDALRNLYKTLTTIATVSLSIIVLTTGVLYTSLNGMMFFKKLAADLGFSPFRDEFVFLYGLGHSFLLVVFLQPAKYYLDHTELKLRKLNLLPAPEAAIAATGGATSATASPAAGIMKMLAQAGAISLPLLTSLLQYLFDMAA